MTDSIPGRVCQPSRSEFSLLFSEIREFMGWDLLESLSMEGSPLTGSRSHGRTIGFNPTTQPNS